MALFSNSYKVKLITSHSQLLHSQIDCKDESLLCERNFRLGFKINSGPLLQSTNTQTIWRDFNEVLLVKLVWHSKTEIQDSSARNTRVCCKWDLIITLGTNIGLHWRKCLSYLPQIILVGKGEFLTFLSLFSWDVLKSN